MFEKYINKKTGVYDFGKPVDGVTAEDMFFNRLEEIQADVRPGLLARALEELLNQIVKIISNEFDVKDRIPDFQEIKLPPYCWLVISDTVEIIKEICRKALICYDVKCPSMFVEYWECRGMDSNIVDAIKDPRKVKSDFALSLPPELDTEAARKYFPRAIKVGYMEVAGMGCKWIAGRERGKVRLGYFLSKVYEPRRPNAVFERFFGVNHIEGAIANSQNTALNPSSKAWRAEIDRQVFYD